MGLTSVTPYHLTRRMEKMLTHQSSDALCLEHLKLAGFYFNVPGLTDELLATLDLWTQVYHHPELKIDLRFVKGFKASPKNQHEQLWYAHWIAFSGEVDFGELHYVGDLINLFMALHVEM